MRKLIIIAFLCVGLTCVVILRGPIVPLVPSPLMAASSFEMSPDLLEDLTYMQNNDTPQLAVSFSHNGFFYSETIYVSITANNPDAMIYFTTDGSNPTDASEHFMRPLELIADESVRCTVLKAIAIDEFGQSSVLTQSYYLGISIDERFSSFVFSLSTDFDNLYGYEQGILVRGKSYDDVIADNPGMEYEEWDEPGNFQKRGREWERPVFVEAFTNNGERIIAQNAGIRVHGGLGSRYLPQKSLRLIARREYEPDSGTFRCDLFTDYLSADAFGTPIMSYDTLILRNDGNDWLYGRIRTPFVSQIARQAGFPTVSPQAGAAVFINGEYYGFAWVNIRANEHFFEKLYNAPQRSFDIFDGGSTGIRSTDSAITSAFREMRDYAEQGFTDETIQYLEDFFDIDNLLFYYALQIYVGNRDWPHNNMRIWRYTGSADFDNLTEELDGRWRFLMFDIDMALNFPSPPTPPDVQSIHRILLDGERPSPIFHALILLPEYAEKLSNFICDMISDHFSAQNVQRVVQELDHQSLRELEASSLASKKDFDEILESRNQLLAYLHERPDYILYELRKLFGYTSMYRIVSDGSCTISTMNGNEGSYFIENRVPIFPVLERGQVFGHWLVNGNVRYDEDLLLSAQDADADGVVYVSLVTHEQPPPLFFKDTFDTGELFGFSMYNPTGTVQSTGGLYLSDNIYNLKKWQFPALNISPGNTWEFVGRNSTSPESLLKIGLNFNPRHGEAIFLSNEEGVILDYVIMQ